MDSKHNSTTKTSYAGNQFKLNNSCNVLTLDMPDLNY